MSYRVNPNNLESDNVFNKKFPSKHHNTNNNNFAPSYLISDSSIKPNPRIGDRIHIIKQNNNISSFFDNNNSASFGHILQVYRDGYYDVRLDNGTSVEKLAPSNVLIIPDIAPSSEYKYLDIISPPSAASPSSPFVSSLSSHTDQILPSFRRTEWRNSTQIEIDNNCTFSPKTNQSCPFISDRSLREDMEKNDNINQDFIDELMEIEIDEVNIEEISDYEEDKNYTIPKYGGMFIPGVGFSVGQPTTTGVNIYLYNENFPPLFDKGIYNKNIIIKKETEVSKEVNNSFNNNTSIFHFPPQIPDWGWMKGGYMDNSSTTKTISKQEIKAPTWGGRSKTTISSKDKEANKSTSGWGSIIEEMQKMKSNGLKKTNHNSHTHSSGAIPIKNNHLVKASKKDKVVGKKIKHTRKFKDIMEEMAYTLAKLRGDINDDADEEEEEQQENLNVDIIKEEIIIEKKEIIIKPPPPPSSLQSKLELFSISTSSKSIECDTINDLKPASIFTNGIGLPAPPPLPKQWPILAPYIYIPSKITYETSIVIIEEPSTLIENLPIGYYLPNINIEKGQIIANGITTIDLINSYKIPILKIKKKIPTIKKVKKIIKSSDNIKKTILSPGNKLTRDDLPLPPNFYDSIERMQRGQELKEKKAKEVEPFLLRNYDDSNTVNKGYISSAKEFFQPTIPVETCVHLEQRLENKNHTFRKNSEMSSDNNLPLYRIRNNVTKVGSNISHLGYSHDVDNVATSIWASSLRSPSSPNSSIISSKIDQNKKSTNNSSISSASTLLLSPKKKQELEYQEYQKQQQNTINNNNNNRTNNNKTKLNSKPSMLGPDHPKQYTIPTAPVFNSQVSLNRTFTLREERKQRELILEKEEKIKEKRRKDDLKKKALEIALSRGVYSPENSKKNRNQAKIFAKYNSDNSSLFGGNSLENLTESARKKYLYQNSLATTTGNNLSSSSSRRSNNINSHSSITSNSSIN